MNGILAPLGNRLFIYYEIKLMVMTIFVCQVHIKINITQQRNQYKMIQHGLALTK